ncbi:hypothetical protein MMC27_006781 [Xylographa pallens]|nr:hypothetical protein [Xylographa pallens]
MGSLEEEIDALSTKANKRIQSIRNERFEQADAARPIDRKLATRTDLDAIFFQQMSKHTLDRYQTLINHFDDYGVQILKLQPEEIVRQYFVKGANLPSKELVKQFFQWLSGIVKGRINDRAALQSLEIYLSSLWGALRYFNHAFSKSEKQQNSYRRNAAFVLDNNISQESRRAYMGHTETSNSFKAYRSNTSTFHLQYKRLKLHEHKDVSGLSSITFGCGVDAPTDVSPEGWVLVQNSPEVQAIRAAEDALSLLVIEKYGSFSEALPSEREALSLLRSRQSQLKTKLKAQQFRKEYKDWLSSLDNPAFPQVSPTSTSDHTTPDRNLQNNNDHKLGLEQLCDKSLED